MRTQKTTRSTLTTSIETGFTRGLDMSVKLASPCQVDSSHLGLVLFTVDHKINAQSRYKKPVLDQSISGSGFIEYLMAKTGFLYLLPSNNWSLCTASSS